MSIIQAGREPRLFKAGCARFLFLLTPQGENHTVNKKRPVNLDLRTIRMPITAKSSILHRLSGVFLFLSLPCLLYVLQQSLASEDGFEGIRAVLSGGVSHIAFVLAIMAVAFHLVAGVRHMIMDAGYGETLSGGKQGAIAVLIIGLGLALALGVWAW